jgi:hypothetical protein
MGFGAFASSPHRFSQGRPRAKRRAAFDAQASRGCRPAFRSEAALKGFVPLGFENAPSFVAVSKKVKRSQKNNQWPRADHQSMSQWPMITFQPMGRPD